jgi:hypothetical protein
MVAECMRQAEDDVSFAGVPFRLLPRVPPAGDERL